ncbi:MAG: hypothetical protein ILO68_07775 [Clostridia bacterium]|nr:hypothetical protein [Clostridia bacterium]
MTDQSISRYDRDGAAYRRDYYETDLRSGEVNYFRTQSVIYDGEGEVCNRTFYRDNKRVSEYTVHTYESYTGTVGNPVIEYEKVVTETTFTESGAVDQVHKESVITTKEKEAATHAVQNYLEKVTGVKRDS